MTRTTIRFPVEEGQTRTWDEVTDKWEPYFQKCGFDITDAGSAQVNGRYVYANSNDNVARYRKQGTNIYLFRWGSMNQRITFPDAVGVVITTGNPEDLTLKQMTLRALDFVGGEFGAGTSPITNHQVTVVTFDKYQSLFVGSMQLANDCTVAPGQEFCMTDTSVYTKFGIVKPHRRDIWTPGDPAFVPAHCRVLEGTQEVLQECSYCTAGPECEDKNEILIPDISGTVITTGNMEELPAMAIPFSSFSAGGTVSLSGDVTFGSPAPDLTASQQSFLHPEYLRYSEPDWITRRGYVCDQFQSNDERCVNNNKRAFCKHASQVSLDTWERTGECHVDVNIEGVKREAILWYTPVDGNVGFTFSAAGEADNLRPSHPVPIEDEETQYTRDPHGKRLGHPLSSSPLRKAGNESSLHLKGSDLSGAGSALRRFLLDGAPLLRIRVFDDSSQVPHVHAKPGEILCSRCQLLVYLHACRSAIAA